MQKSKLQNTVPAKIISKYIIINTNFILITRMSINKNINKKKRFDKKLKHEESLKNNYNFWQSSFKEIRIAFLCYKIAIFF